MMKKKWMTAASLMLSAALLFAGCGTGGGTARDRAHVRRDAWRQLPFRAAAGGRRDRTGLGRGALTRPRANADGGAAARPLRHRLSRFDAPIRYGIMASAENIPADRDSRAVRENTQADQHGGGISSRTGQQGEAGCMPS